MGTDKTLDVFLPGEGRRFTVDRSGRRWTKVPEYMTNGQLTARFFVDESTGEVRPARSWKSPENWPLTGERAEFVLGIIAAADAVDRPTRRDLLKVGEEFVGSWGEELERAIAVLEWEAIPISRKLPFSQGLVIRKALKEFKIDQPTRVALYGSVRVALSGQWESLPLYGIEAEYENAKIRLYLLDQGAVASPLFIDVWEKVAGGLLARAAV